MCLELMESSSFLAENFLGDKEWQGFCLTLNASEELCKLLKYTHVGSVKPCFRPDLQGKYFPTGKATTLEDLSVISTHPIIFLNLVLLVFGWGRRGVGQVLPRGTFSLPSLRI